MERADEKVADVSEQDVTHVAAARLHESLHQSRSAPGRFRSPS